MVLAVGHLELQVTVARRDENHARAPRGNAAQSTTLAQAYERARLERAVEADRAHWAALANLSGPRLP